MNKALMSFSAFARAFTLVVSFVGLSAAVIAQSPPPAPVITSPTNGALSASTSVTISGTQDPTVITVELFDGVTSLGMSTLGTGTFSATVTLAEGVHVLTAVADDGLMNGTSTSSAVTITVDTTSPVAPVIVNTLPSSPSNSQTPVVSGTAEAAATITVSDGTSTIGTTTADGSGNWSVTVSTMAEGSYSLTATATDAAANVSNPSATFPLTIDTTAPAAPVIVNTLPSSPSNSQTPVVSGTAEAGSAITVSDGTSTIGTTTADGSGNWSVTVSSLSEGNYTLTATATDAATNVSNAATGFALVVDTTAPAAPSIVSSLPVSPSNSATPVISGTSEANASITVSDGTSTIGTTTANGTGNWSVTVSSMAEGSYSLTATATDAATNVSNAATGFALIVDTTAPSVPTNVLATTPTTTAPALSWTASTDVTTAVASYNVWRDDGQGSNLIGSTSNVNYTDSSLTIGGTYTYTVSAVDSAGNESSVSSGMAVVYSIPLPSNILTVGTNGTYATISAALTAAAGLASTANAVIKVETGNYDEFTVNGLALPQSTRIVADAGATVTITPVSGPVAINQIAWTQSFEMAGISMNVGAYSGIPLVVTACDGTVHLRDGTYLSTTGIDTVSAVACAQLAIANVTFGNTVSVATNSVVAMNNVTGSTLTVTNTSIVTGFGLSFTSTNPDGTSSVTSYTGAACDLSITPRFATQNQSISIDLASGLSNGGQMWVLAVSASPILHWNNDPVSTGSPLVLGASLIANSNVFIVDTRVTNMFGNDSLAVAGLTDPYFFGLPLVFQGVVLDATSSNYHVTTAATYIQLP